MAEITNADIDVIQFQDDVDSFPHRTNYANIKNRHNQLNATVNALSTAASGAEITASRPNHQSLKDRLDSDELGQINFIKTGGIVAERSTPVLSVKISALQAKVGGVDIRKGFGAWARSGATITMTEENHGRSNGNTIDVDVSSDIAAIPLQEYTIAGVTTDTFTFTGISAGATSGTTEHASITAAIAVPTNSRFDIVVINSDNTLSVVTGGDSTDPILPAIASTQRTLARIDMTSGLSVISNTEIIDISTQGCDVIGEGQFFKIQDAVDSLNDRTNSIEQGDIIIHKGDYYEEVDLTGKSNITLKFESGARIFRTADSVKCIKSINTGGNETTGIKIIGGDLRGNGKAGANELLRFEFTDEFIIDGCVFDGNASSTATNEDFLIDNCDKFRIINNFIDDYSDTTDITNSIEFLEDGYHTGQVTFCGTTAEKARMLKKGWTVLSGMDDRMLMADVDTAETSSGSIARDGTINIAHIHDDFGTTGTIASQASANPIIQRAGGEMGVAGVVNGTQTKVERSTNTKLSTTQAVFPQYFTLIPLRHR